MSPPRRIAQVILDTRLPQLDRLFDYEVPPEFEVVVGAKVKVPLRNRKTPATGYVVGLSDSSEHSGKLAPISAIISPVGLLSPDVWALAKAVAERQAGSSADVLRLAIPPRYVRAEKKWLESQDLTPADDAPPGAVAPAEGFADDVWEKTLAAHTRTALYLPHGVIPGPQGTDVPRAVASICALAHTAVAQGQSLLIVVPTWRHIALYEDSLRATLPEDLLVLLHSDLAPAERYSQYLRCLENRPTVILGTRHALYAPAHNLAGIVVVDDSDESHSEPLAPYPHSRDVALIRAGLVECAVVFASVVPSLSVMRWLEQGYVTPLASTVSHRAQVIPTELSVGVDQNSAPARLPSVAFRAAKEALARGPVLVQVFRAGFSTGLACASCGERGYCVACHGPLKISAKGAKPSCAWCGVGDSVWKCASCHHTTLVPRGHGIERTVADIGRAFPTVPVVRSDGEHRVLRVPATPALVIATRGAEPLAEGGYQAALLLDGAGMLSRESLSALEDSLQAWETAISLVARTGTAYLTDVTGQPAMAVSSGHYEPLLRHELQQRQAVKLPPTIRIASISGSASLVARARETLEQTGGVTDVLGPVAMEDGIRIIVRFSYAMGQIVTKELRSLRAKIALGGGRNPTERLRIVVDDPDRLDSLFHE